MHRPLSRRGILLRSLAATALGALRAPAWAETYPSRPLRMVIPFAAGGPNDVTGRLVCDELARRIGQPVIIENKPGAGGNIGAEFVARAPADGYTLFWAQAATHGINPWIYKKVGFDPVKDFAPVGLVAQAPLMVLTHPRSGLKSLTEVLERARANPDSITFASGGNGTSPHVAGELLKSMAGVRMRHIPYRGSAAALNDAIAGQVDLVFDGIQSAQAFVRSGQLIALGVATRERLADLPQVPTMAETVPGFEALTWSGIVAPAGTPAAVATLINRELNRCLQAPALKERFAQLHITATGGSPEQMDRFIRQELEKWRKVATDMAISVE